ncbi:MAG: histidine kinase, partial [Bacteroidota bacterium]
RDQQNKAMLYSIRDSAGQLVVTQYAFGDHAAKFVSAKKTMGVAHGQVYFGTKGGIFRTHINDLRTLAPIPHVHVREVYARQQLLPNARHHNLRYDQNSIYLLFEAISFEHTPVQIRCQLVGFDQDWQLPKYDALQYTNLDPGDYRFLVQARAVGDPWGPLETISFHIETTYWKTWLFVLTVIVLGLLAVGSSFRLWYRAQRRRTTLLIEKAQAEQRALRAQMNPHFIFNALSSIQDLVFNENRMFAVTNIALFARLMRKILAHSSRENVTLTEEIETLTLYLKLESLRFEDRFHFEISVAEGIDQDSRMLPPLFIQPFAENAIKHGLLNKQPAGGELLIHFRQQGGALLCTIEDNGVGRAQAAELRSQRNPAHRSFSTHSVTERIRLLNAQRTNRITLNIVDLYDADQQPSGTRIELLIPPKTSFNDAISHYR